MKKLAEYIWINGKYSPWDEALVHSMTHSLHYSGAVYEGIRSYNGRIFKLEEHIDRLFKSASSMGLELQMTNAEVMDICSEIIVKNDIPDSYIRPLVWRGAETIRMYQDELSTNLLVAAIPSRPDFRAGLKIDVSKWRKPPANSVDPQAKSSGHYGMAILNQQESKARGFDDTLLLDQAGNIAECTVSNIFFASGDQIVTPMPKEFLDGITRQFVIQMAAEMGYYLVERTISPDELKDFNTCFITGTSVEIAPIELINHNGKEYKFNNKIVPALQQEFAKRVGK